MTLKKFQHILIFVSIVLTTYFLFRYYNWPGKRSLFLVIPVIYGIFHLFKAILSFFKRRWSYALISLMCFCLFLLVTLKLTYYYYNIFIAICVLLIGVYIYFKFRYKRLDKNSNVSKELYTLTGLIYINSFLTVLPQKNLMLKLFLDDCISWRQLNWSDFQGTITDSEKHDATTSSSIYHITNRVYNYPPALIFSYFDKKSSQKRNGNEGNRLLIHEQGHFNITEMLAQNARDAVSKYWGKSPKYIDSIINIYNCQIDKQQSFYDLVTKHGTDTIEQKKWTDSFKELYK